MNFTDNIGNSIHFPEMLKDVGKISEIQRGAQIQTQTQNGL